MGATANALSRLAGTVERGYSGLGNSAVQNAGLLHRLKRQQVLDDRNKRLFDAKMTSANLQAAKDRDLMQMGTLSLADGLPSRRLATPSNMAWLLGANKNSDSPLVLDAARYATGDPNIGVAPGDKTMTLIDATGKPLSMPKWKRNQIIEQMGNYYVSQSDPVYNMEGRIADREAQLAHMDQGTERGRRAQYEQEIRQAKDYLKNPATQINLYNQHFRRLVAAKNAAIAKGADPAKLKPFDDAIARAQGKAQSIYASARAAQNLELKEREVAAKELTAEAKMKTASKEKADPFIEGRIKQINKSIGEIDSLLTTGYVKTDSGDVPITNEQKLQLLNQRAQLYGEAQNLQAKPGGVAKPKPTVSKPKTETSKPGEIAGRAIIELRKTGKPYDPQKVAGKIAQKDGIAAANAFLKIHEKEAVLAAKDAPVTQTRTAGGPGGQQPQYVQVAVDENGTVWGQDANGRTVRIATKPPEKIYNGRFDNPEFQNYIALLKHHGLIK